MILLRCPIHRPHSHKLKSREPTHHCACVAYEQKTSFLLPIIFRRTIVEHMFLTDDNESFLDLLVGSKGPIELNGLDNEVIEECIIELCAHISSLNSKWLELVAEFDKRKLYEQWGCRSSAHWLSLKCGISLSTGYEHVRVAKSMVSHTDVHKSFSDGEISYSKLRAITRVVNQDNQEFLVQLAKIATGSQLAQIVGAFSGALQSQDTQLEEVRYKKRYLTYRYDDDGSLVGFFRLPPETGALFVHALEGAKAEIQKQQRADKRASKGQDSRNYDSPAEVFRNSDSDDHGDSPAEESDQFVGSGESEANNDSPAEESANSTYDHFPDTSDTCNTSPLDPSNADNPYGASNCDGLALMSELSLAKLQELTSKNIFVRPQTSVVIHMNEANDQATIQNGPLISGELARRLSCDAKLVRYQDQDPSNIYNLNFGRKRRLVTQRQKRALVARDKGCRFPDCKQTRYVNAHHIIHWSHGGNSDLDNLVLLCSFHHHQVHEGGIKMEKDSQGYLHFYNRTGREVENHSQVIDRLYEKNIHFNNTYLGSEAFSNISNASISPSWSGESLDLVCTLDALFSVQDKSKSVHDKSKSA